MSAEMYLKELAERFERLRNTQLGAIEDVAVLCADAIASGGLVHLFGTGHGSIPALDAFPRTGSYVGWHPIVIDAVGPHLRVGGNGSVHQFRYLQAAQGYGKAILDSFPLHPQDPFIVCSHSGVNRVVLEVAHELKVRGHTLIAITSLEHSRQATSRHASGRRLFEIADHVLDTQAPFGDAAIELSGLNKRVAVVSTSLATAIINALVAQTAQLLVARHVDLLVLGHIDTKGQHIPDEMRRDYTEAFLDRLWRRSG